MHDTTSRWKFHTNFYIFRHDFLVFVLFLPGWLNWNINYFDFMSKYLMVQKLRHFENLQSWLWAFRIRGQLLCQP